MVEKLQPSQEHNSVIVQILSEIRLIHGEIRAINTGIEDMQHQMDMRFEAVDRRFDDMLMT